jgi:hypothetical protein
VRKRTAWTIGLVAVVAIGGGAFTVKTVRASIHASEMCTAVHDQQNARGVVITTEGVGSSIGILGDSWTTGDGLSDYHNAWPFVLAEVTGKTVVVAGEAGTGFLNPGYCGDGLYSERAVDLPATGQTVIAGELNDVNMTLDDIDRALTATVDVFTGRVTVIGPVDVPGRDGEKAVDAALNKAAHLHGINYVSALTWDIETGPDGVHPTVDGARQYAALVAQVIH